MSDSTRDTHFHKGDGRNVHVQTKGCMFVVIYFTSITLAWNPCYSNVFKACS